MASLILRQAVVERVDALDEHIVEVTCVADGRFTWKAGQWLSFQVGEGGPRGKGIWRVYSLSSAAHEAGVAPQIAHDGATNGSGNGGPRDAATAKGARFRVLVETEAEGPGGRRFAALQAGDRLTWHGPYGKFVLRWRHAEEIVMAADGVGIGPVRAMVVSLAEDGAPPARITLVQQAAHHGTVPYERELAALAERSRGALRYIVTRPDGSDRDERRPLPELIRSLFPAPARVGADWYLCGSGRCTDPVRGWLRGAGVADAAVRVERFFD